MWVVDSAVTPHQSALLTASPQGEALSCSVKHIFNKNAAASGGVVDQNVGHRANELAVLDDGGATRPLPVAEEGRGASGSGR